MNYQRHREPTRAELPKVVKPIALRWWVAAAAAILLGAGILWAVLSMQSTPAEPVAVMAQAPADQTEAPAVPPPSVDPAPVIAFWRASARPGNAREAWVAARAAFDSAKAAHARTSEFKEIVRQCEEIIEGWPGTPEEMEARRLISRCYTQMAEYEKAREAFLAYADTAGQQERRNALARGNDAETAQAVCNKTTAALVTREVEDLCQSRAYNRALAYCDILTARYPGVATEQFAGMTRAQSYEEYKDAHNAIAEYERITSAKENTEWTPRAYMALPILYGNSGKHDKAMATYQELIKRFPDDAETAAGAYVNMGFMYSARGKKYYPQAIESFNIVINRYPQITGYVSVAKEGLANIEKYKARDAEKELP